MKRLWVKLFYIILLLQTSVLFAQTQNGTIEFNSGYSIYGEILSIYEKPSNLGNKVEVVFRGDVSKLDKIPAIAVIKEIDEYTVVLKGESISKIFGTVGIIFNDGKYLGDEINKKEYRNYPKGPVQAVSYAPAGVGGGLTPNNQFDLVGDDMLNAYQSHIDKVATTVGMELVDYLKPSNQ